jgi:hypothetical protein
MLSAKRVIITTICGFVFGLFCMYLASSNPQGTAPLSATTKCLIVISRTLLGFTIGISALRLNWWLHGFVLGIICSIPMAIPVLDRPGIAVSTIVMGIVYGVLTELITSKGFKAKAVGA